VTTLSWDSQTLQQEHTWRAFALSAAAHTVLLAGLVWGVSISSQTPALVEAEIWTSLPQIAAPEPMETDESERFYLRRYLPLSPIRSQRLSVQPYRRQKLLFRPKLIHPSARLSPCPTRPQT
jgi:hypothetical protein